MSHVLTRLTGFGLTLLPYWPYEFEREAGDHVRVTRWTVAGPVHAVVDPGAPAGDPEVVDLGDGLQVSFWLLETSVFRTRWPAGFSVSSAQEHGDGTAFYLHGPGEASIFPQGPVPRARLAGPDALVAPGQEVATRRTGAGGVTVIELTYTHEGGSWWQGHWTIPCRHDRFLVITAQSLLDAADGTREAAEAVVAHVEETG